MDIEKNLILIRNEDKTDQIFQCERSGDIYNITYKSNNHDMDTKPKTVYPYHNSNAKWYTDPCEIDVHNIMVYENGNYLSNIVKILVFNEYVKIFFENQQIKLYPKSTLSIEPTNLVNELSTNCFEYLTKIAYAVGLIIEETGTNILAKQYTDILRVDSKSSLSVYLQLCDIKHQDTCPQLIFPFGINLSQKAAVEKVFTNQLSVIEGPPGTGKTQTILNIIANAIINNKTVAIVSFNNSATSNVFEKLQKYDLGFIAALLGNKVAKETFFNSQTGLYPNMLGWDLDQQTLDVLEEKLPDLQNQINEMLDIQTQIAILKQELYNLTVEKKYFYEYYNEIDRFLSNTPDLRKMNSNKLISLWTEYQHHIETKEKTTFFYKLSNFFNYGIYNFNFYKNPNEDIITLFQKKYYDIKEQELNTEVQTLSKKLSDFNFDVAMKTYSNDSMKLLKSYLYNKFSQKDKREQFSESNFCINFKNFITEYPIVLSTTYSLRSCKTDSYLFDYIIIDESSQVDIATGALALSCAKNAVIVGDLNQLPNVVDNNERRITTEIFNAFNLNCAYNYAENSLLSSITKLYPHIPRTLLKEHYRCHPKIIGFCNQKFYNSELVILTEDTAESSPLLVYKTSEGNHARGRYNQRQIDVIFEEILSNEKIDINNSSIGIISPYRLQAEKIRDTTKEMTEISATGKIEADTVHKYQGREKDVVILTTVANKINNFIDDPHLINVAVSRAVEKLIVVVSNNAGEEGTNIGDLIKYIQYNNFDVINSEIYSVFDLLYSSYSEKLLHILKKLKNVSEFKSEVLMNTVIEKVLDLPTFKSLGFILHQPINLLIKDKSILNDSELKFVLNPLSHTDFLIFNKMDKTPVLVVEVDGYAFHAENSKQLTRDNMKDSIFKKYSIPILRIRTNDSGEETKLIKKLSEILHCSD